MTEKQIIRGSIVRYQKHWLVIMTEDSSTKFLSNSNLNDHTIVDWSDIKEKPPSWFFYDSNYNYSFLPPELL